MKTVTADEHKRVTIPVAGPNQVFDYTVNPDGSVLLTPLKKAESPARIVKLVMRDGELVMDIPKGYTLDQEALLQSIDEMRREAY